MGFSFEEAAFIQKLKNRHFIPSPVDDYWDFDEYGAPEEYELYVSREQLDRDKKADELAEEWDIKIDRARKKQKKRL